jgi:hypothetical protein
MTSEDSYMIGTDLMTYDNIDDDVSHHSNRKRGHRRLFQSGISLNATSFISGALRWPHGGWWRPLCPDRLWAHPASCTMGIRGRFPEAKAQPGRGADHSPYLEWIEAILPLPQAPRGVSFCSAWTRPRNLILKLQSLHLKCGPNYRTKY